MKVKIEDYRGFEISFDTEAQTFHCYSSYRDMEGNEKKSFASVKKYIDDYLKENESFNQVMIATTPDNDNRTAHALLTGIRKDRRFTMLLNNENEQLREYDEKNWVIWTPEWGEARKSYKEYSERIDALKKERDEMIAKYKFTTVKEYKRTILNSQ